MIPKEILKKIQHIQIYTSHLVNDTLGGCYESVFKGQGMEFEEVREYQPGDEIRSIDWNVTARFGKPYVKKFVEERELTVMLMVDASSSGNFGSAGQLKKELAAELCAALAFSAIKNNDKVGLIIFTDRIEKFVPPKKGKRHVLRVIREVLYYQPEGHKTDIAAALEYLSRVSQRRTVTFLISDFIDSDFRKALQIANKHHDIIAVTITDRRELELPRIGFITLQDAETAETLLIDTTSESFRCTFREKTQEKKKELLELFRSANVDTINVRTDQPYLQPLLRFFRMRERRM